MLSETDLELLSAYLDGALSESERTALEARLQTDAELRRELARLRATVELVKSLPNLTPPRDLTLTPRMVRRPTILTSAAFSVLSAAAAVVLLIVGSLLFTSSQQANVQPAAAPPLVAFAATNTSNIPLLKETSVNTPNVSSAGSAGNLQVVPQVVPSETQEAAGGVSNDMLRAAPTDTEIPLLQAFSAIISPTETFSETLEAQESQVQDAAAAEEATATNEAHFLAQQAAPLAMNGAAASAAQAPLPAQMPATPTTLPTSTPVATSTPTSSLPPTDTMTATHVPTPTTTNTPLPTDTPSPTATPTPVPLLTVAPETAGTVGIGVIVLAILLLIVAVVTTILRRRS